MAAPRSFFSSASIAKWASGLLVVALAACEVALILSARKHYTADVMVAGYVGVLLFYCGVKYFPDASGAEVVGGKGDVVANRKASTGAGHQYEQLAMSSQSNGVPLRGTPRSDQAGLSR